MITKDQVIQSLRTIKDSEVPVNIWDLGLIYDLTIDPEKDSLHLQMTFTRIDSPSKETIPAAIKETLQHDLKAKNVEIAITFEPEWTPERITEEGKRRLGIEA